jgi:tetratricopeptide (TPR) repeat protein
VKPALAANGSGAGEVRRCDPTDAPEIVKPADDTHLGFQVALKELTGSGSAGGVIDSARLAVESRHFQQAIDTLWPHRDELDDQGLVTLALALESAGRQQEAIDLLVSATASSGTDPAGVLAGRLKRRWLVERRRADAEQALALYAQSLERDPAQAYYHAINCAFMELAYGGDVGAFRAYADRALHHCATAPDNVWRRATLGEANLYVGNTALSADAYRRAIAANPEPRQAASLYQQAYRAADLMGEETLGAELQVMFGQASASS